VVLVEWDATEDSQLPLGNIGFTGDLSPEDLMDPTKAVNHMKLLLVNITPADQDQIAQEKKETLQNV